MGDFDLASPSFGTGGIGGWDHRPRLLDGGLQVDPSVPVSPQPTETQPPLSLGVPTIVPPIAQEQIPSVLSGGEPLTDDESVSGGQASPPSSLREALKVLGFSDTQIAGLTDEELENGISLDELRKLDPDKTIITDMAYNLLTRGGLGVNALGGVAADEDGIQLADVNRFLTEVVAPLVSGTGRSLEVIARFLKANKFRVTSRHAAARAFRESTKEKEGLWTTTDGTTTLSVKTLIDKYVRGELKGLAGKVLANILGHEVSETDRLTEDQLADFFLTMYFMGKSDSPENIMSEAKDIPELEGDSPAKLIAWLTQGAEEPVRVEETSSSESAQEQGDFPADWPADLVAAYEIIATPTAQGGVDYRNPETVETADYENAKKLLQNVLLSSVEEKYRRQAAEGWMVCTSTLSDRSGVDLAEMIDSSEPYLEEVATLLGASKASELRNHWLELAQSQNREDLAMGQIKLLADLYLSNDRMASTDVPRQLARLAYLCSGFQNVAYRRYALELMDNVKNLAPQEIRMPGQQAADGSQGEGQTIRTEVFAEEIKQRVENHPLLIEAEAAGSQLRDKLKQAREAQQSIPSAQLHAEWERIADLYQAAITALSDDLENAEDPINIEDLAHARVMRADCLVQASMTTEQTDENRAIKEQGEALLGLLHDAAGLVPNGEGGYLATGSGLLPEALTTLTGLIAAESDPEKKTMLESLREQAAFSLAIIAQTLVRASTARGVDRDLKVRLKAAYKAVAKLMRDLGLEEVSLGGSPLRDFIRAIERGGSSTSIDQVLDERFRGAFSRERAERHGGQGGSGGDNGPDEV